MTSREGETRIRRALAGSAVLLVIAAGLLGGLWLTLNQPAPEAAIEERPVTGPVPMPTMTPLPPIRFTDITQLSGIDFTHESGATGERYLPETMGGGVAFLDYDDDGHQDLFFVNGQSWPWSGATISSSTSPFSALYRGNGDGTFVDVSHVTGLDLRLYGMGAAVGDYDGDGDVDLFVTAVGENRLLENVSGERFVDATEKMGVSGAPDDWSTCATFFDYDRDGDLDLFVCNYVRWSREIDERVDYRLTGIGRAYGPPTDFGGTDSTLYRNDGARFTNVSETAGITVESETTGQPVGKALAVMPLDVDKDGWLDLAVANDTVRNFLFHNRGDGTFVEIGKESGFAFDSAGSATGAMGIDALGSSSARQIAIGNFASEMTSFYKTTDGRTFTDDAIVAGIGPTSRRALTFGVLFTDVDLDGRLDFLQVNGHVEPEINRVQSGQRYRQPLQLFWHCGTGCPRQFRIVDPFLPQLNLAGRGAAYADIDGDGDEDLVITQINDQPVVLRNDSRANHHFIALRLRGKAANTRAIGATVEVIAGSQIQEKTVMPTRSYLSQVALPLIFGLGRRAEPISVQVRWPDGTREAWHGLETDRYHTLRMGDGGGLP